jgi:CheY-like chemotaxis protein
MKSDIRIVVIHDDIKEHSRLLTKLRESFTIVKLIDDPEIGIEYLTQNIAEKIIVILDIDFGDGTDGYMVLEKIRELTFLIEVIILSAKEDVFDHIDELFGLRTFNYVVRGTSGADEKLIDSIFKAKEKIDNSIGSAIDQWIEVQGRDRRNKPYIIYQDGKAYTLNDLKEAINKRTKGGLELEKKIKMMAIKMLMNRKDS